MGSKNYPAPSSQLLYGILMNNPQKNPDFYNFNRVRVMYCSSDFWFGTRSASAESGNYHFQGKNIVRAVFDSLQKNQQRLGVSLANAEEVLFAGGSAGGAGVQHNLDDMGEILPSSVNLRGFIDSLWGSSRDKIKAEGLPLDVLSNEQLDFWKPKPDQSCAEANADAFSKCGGESLFPFLDHEIFVFIDQSDANFNKMNANQVATFKKLRRNALNDVSGGFSPDLGIHGSLGNKEFFDLDINGVAYKDVIANWFFKRSGPKKLMANS